jgi:hypothetical protein
MEEPRRASLSDLALRVLRYLMDYPAAGDTIDGIQDWWLSQRDRVREPRASLERALGELEAQALITVLHAADGRSHYRLNTRAVERARRLLAAADGGRAPGREG